MTKALRGHGHTSSEWAFGHGGAKGQIGWADPATGISLGFMTHGLDRNDLVVGRRGSRLLEGRRAHDAGVALPVGAFARTAAHIAAIISTTTSETQPSAS